MARFCCFNSRYSPSSFRYGPSNRFLVKAKLPEGFRRPELAAFDFRRNVVCETYLGVAVVVIVACLGVTPPARHP